MDPGNAPETVDVEEASLLPEIFEISVFSKPNLGSSSSTQPNANGNTGTKIDSHARISIAPRPGMSVRAMSHVNASAIGSEMAVRVTARAKLFHKAPMADASANACCQLPAPKR